MMRYELDYSDSEVDETTTRNLDVALGRRRRRSDGGAGQPSGGKPEGGRA